MEAGRKAPAPPRHKRRTTAMTRLALPRLTAALRRQDVLRPVLATSLLFAVVATLGAAEVRAQSFDLSAAAPTRAAAAQAISARAGRNCGFVRPDRGWHPQHQLSGLACTTRDGLAHCQARATCTPPAERQLALR